MEWQDKLLKDILALFETKLGVNRSSAGWNRYNRDGLVAEFSAPKPTEGRPSRRSNTILVSILQEAIDDYPSDNSMYQKWLNSLSKAAPQLIDLLEPTHTPHQSPGIINILLGTLGIVKIIDNTKHEPL